MGKALPRPANVPLPAQRNLAQEVHPRRRGWRQLASDPGIDGFGDLSIRRFLAKTVDRYHGRCSHNHRWAFLLLSR